MTTQNLCINCKHVDRNLAIGYICRTVDEKLGSISPVDGKKKWAGEFQHTDCKNIRRNYCMGNWYEEKPKRIPFWRSLFQLEMGNTKV